MPFAGHSKHTRMGEKGFIMKSYHKNTPASGVKTEAPRQNAFATSSKGGAAWL